MERVFPDANVLYPISVADLFLRLGELYIHDVLWSQDLLREVERVLIEHKGLAAEAAAYFCDCIREAFPEGEIPRSSYEHLIPTRTGPDPDDWVHSAAAVGGGATILLSTDRRGFPKRDLGDVRRVSPDAYFSELLIGFPAEILSVVNEMGSQRKAPQAVGTTLSALAQAGLPQFAAGVDRLLAR